MGSSNKKQPKTYVEDFKHLMVGVLNNTSDIKGFRDQF